MAAPGPSGEDGEGAGLASGGEGGTTRLGGGGAVEAGATQSPGEGPSPAGGAWEGGSRVQSWGQSSEEGVSGAGVSPEYLPVGDSKECTMLKQASQMYLKLSC